MVDVHVGALAGLHVLVVEDNRDARQIFSGVLTYYGAYVTSVATAAAGLSHLRAIKPDLVLADFQLPDHDAAWLVRQAARRDIRVPFVAVSGADLDERQLQGFEASLRKPVDHGRLVETILAVVRR